MTRNEVDILRDVAARRISRDYFDSYPAKRPIAKSLMWSGFIEHAYGDKADLRLTPAGQAALKQNATK